MKNQNLTLRAYRMTKEQAEKALKIGKGNESEGVRTAIEEYKVEVRSDTKEDYKITLNK